MPPYNYNHNSKEQFFSEIVQYGMYIEDSSGNIIDSSEGLIRPKCKLGISDRMLEFIRKIAIMLYVFGIIKVKKQNQ